MTEAPPVPSAPNWIQALSEAQTAQDFAAALCDYALDAARAHGAQFSLGRENGLEVLAEVGRGLALADGTLALAALAARDLRHDGSLSALGAGRGVLELVGAREEGLQTLAELAPLLALALEGVLAREARRGRGRVAEVVANLVRRLGGSLDLGEVLTATAESAARAVGFQRAFVGLFKEFGPHGARTDEVYTYGFTEDFAGGIGVGPESFERLLMRGEAILYDRTRDVGSPLAHGLAELSPERCLIAPLAARGRPLGVLYVDTTLPGARLSDDEVWVALALAEQASLAIDNARLYAEELRKRRTAEALREVGQALSGSLRLADTLERLLEYAARLLGADACAVYELLPDGRTLAIRSALGLPTEYVLRARARLGTGVVGKAVERGQSVTVRDMQTERVELGSRYTRQLLASGQYPFKGVMGLPLSARGQTFGGLVVYFKVPLALDQGDLALAEVLAAQASLAIDNARLFEEEVRRERESAVLVQVSRLLGQNRAPGALAQVTELAVAAMNAERGLIVVLQDGEPSEVATHHLRASEADLLSLVRQMGRGPRRLTRRHCLDGAASGLVVPLRSGERTFGLLYADHAREEAASDRTLQMSRAIADQVSLALSREQLLEALEREEARYRQLAEGAHDLIIACDPGGHVTYANPASARLLGELAGRSLLDLPDAPWRAPLLAAWNDCLAHPKKSGSCEIEVVGLAGGVRLELRLSAVAREREVTGMLVVARDISELSTLADEIARRGQALEQASARQVELRTFLSLFTQAQEEERGRISRELHDDTAQVLVAIGRRIDRLTRELNGDLKDRAEDIRADLNAAIASVRRFARNLRPSVLDDLGLLPALEWLAGQAATPTRVEVRGSERRLRSDAELTVFRVVQEALTNVDKHARASSAAVRVTYGDHAVELSVQDDGQGFETNQHQNMAARGHLGLLGLRERIELAGGSLDVDSAPGQGSELKFTLPG